MSLLLKQPRVKQPRSFVKLRPSVPFKFAYIPPLGRVSLAGSAEWFDARGAGLPERTDTSGSAVYSGGVTNAERWTGVATGPEFTVIAVVLDSVGRGTNRSPVDADNNSTVGRNWQFRFGSSNRLEFFVFNTVPNTFGTGPTVTSSATEPSVMVGRVAGGVVNSWLNGVGGTPVTITGTQQTLLATEMLGIGGRVDHLGAVSQFFPGNVYGVFIADALPEALIESFVSPDEVWSWAFEPKRIWVPATEVVGAVTLTAAGASQAATSGTGAASQTHNLAGAAASQSATSAAGATSQVHALSAADSSQSSTSASGAIASVHELTAAACAQTASSGTGVVALAQALAAADATQSASSATGAVTQAHVLAGAASSEAATSASGTVTQTHQLVADGATQEGSSGTGAVTGSGTLIAATATQSANSGTGAISQAHALAASDSSASATSSAGSVDQAHGLTAAAASQSATSAAGAVTTSTGIAGADAVQTASSGVGAVTQSHALVADASAGMASSGTGAVSLAQALEAADCAQTASAGTGAVTQTTTINLVAAGASQAASSTTGAASQEHNLFGSPALQAALSGSSIVVQTHELLAAASAQGALSGVGAVANYLPRKALVVRNGVITQIADGEIGTGLTPLVKAPNGLLVYRTSIEQRPVILDEINRLRLLRDGEGIRV